MDIDNSITLIYYTANLIDEQFATNIRNELLKFNLPIISVSHKPLDFGDNLCVYGYTPCIYNVYRQILMGAEKVQTKYMACCEDDSLYTPEHFEHRPTDDVFIYNTNRWRVYPNKYLFKHRKHPTSAGMWNCIAPTELMVKTLQTRFEKYPVKGSQIGWGEPGRHEEYLGLPLVKVYAFKTNIPNVTFAHNKGLGGTRRTAPSDITQPELPYWGSAKDLWKRMWDGNGKLV